MKYLHYIAFTLLVIGGLNWLLIGLFGWGVEVWLGAALSRWVYILVGLSAVWVLFTHWKDCKMCGKSAM